MKHFLIKNKLNICGAGGGGGGGGGGSAPNPPAIISQYPSVITPPTVGNLVSISSFSYAEIIDLLSDGPIEGLINSNGRKLYDENIFEGIYLNETPIKQNSSLRVQSFDVSTLSEQLKSFWKRNKFLLKDATSELILKDVLTNNTNSTNSLRFTDNATITAYTPNASLNAFFNATSSDFSYKNVVQRAFDMAPNTTQKLFLTKITLSKIQLDLTKLLFDLSEGLAYNDDMPLVLSMSNLGDHIYYTITLDNLNTFNYFELPRSFVLNNAVSANGRKTFFKNLISNDASKDFATYELYNLNIFIWSIYDQVEGILNFDNVLDRYFKNIKVYQNDNSLYNYNLVNSEFKNGSEYQLPLKNFNSVNIDTVYNKELIGPFRLTNSLSKADDPSSYVSAGVQKLTSLQCVNGTEPTTNVSLVNETSDDIRYIKSWAVETNRNGDPYVLCCLYANYSLFDKTSAARSQQDAVPITHYIANQNVESVYVTIGINSLSDMAATDLVANNSVFQTSSKSANASSVPYGSPTFAAAVDKYTSSYVGNPVDAYFLVFGPNAKNGYVLDGSRDIKTLGCNLKDLTTLNSSLYLATLGQNGLAPLIGNDILNVNLITAAAAGGATSSYTPSESNKLVNYLVPNINCFVAQSFKIDAYVSNRLNLQKKLGFRNDNGSLYYCFGMNENEQINTSYEFVDVTTEANSSNPILPTINTKNSTSKFWALKYQLFSIDTKSTDANLVKTKMITAIDVRPYIDWSQIFVSYNSLSMSMPSNSTNMAFDPDKYPNIKKYIVDQFLLKTGSIPKNTNGDYVFSTTKPPESYLPQLFLIGFRTSQFLSNWIATDTNKQFFTSDPKAVNAKPKAKLDFLEYCLDNNLLKTTTGTDFANFDSGKEEYSHTLTEALENLLKDMSVKGLTGSDPGTELSGRSIYSLYYKSVKTAPYFSTTTNTNVNFKSSAAGTTYTFLSASSGLFVDFTAPVDGLLNPSPLVSDTVIDPRDFIVYFQVVSNIIGGNSAIGSLPNKVTYNFVKAPSTGAEPVPTKCDFSSATANITAGTRLPAIVQLRVETGYDSTELDCYTGPCEYFSYKFAIFGLAGSQTLLDLGRNRYDYVYQSKESLDIGGYYTSRRPSYIQLPSMASQNTTNLDAALPTVIPDVKQENTFLAKFWTIEYVGGGMVTIFQKPTAANLFKELQNDICTIDVTKFIQGFDGYKNQVNVNLYLPTNIVRGSNYRTPPPIVVGNPAVQSVGTATNYSFYVDNRNNFDYNKICIYNNINFGSFSSTFQVADYVCMGIDRDVFYSTHCAYGNVSYTKRFLGIKVKSVNCNYDYGFTFQYPMGLPKGVSRSPDESYLGDRFYVDMYNDPLRIGNTVPVSWISPADGTTCSLFFTSTNSPKGNSSNINKELLKRAIETFKFAGLDKSYSFASFNERPRTSWILYGRAEPISYILSSFEYQYSQYATYAIKNKKLKYEPSYKVSYWEVPVTNVFGSALKPLNNIYANLYGSDKDLQISLPPPKYNSYGNPVRRYVRVTKLSHETLSPLINKNISLNKITEVVPQKFSYPFSAIVGTKIDSRAFSQIPTRTFLAKLKKVLVPTNYFPISYGTTDQNMEVDVRYLRDAQEGKYKIYEGDWDGQFKLAWTDNPAWILMDLLINKRYGLGNYISSDQIDIWELYKISRWCDNVDEVGFYYGVSDGNGGTQPRHTFNFLIQEKFNIYDLINQVASVFHGRVYYMNSLITFDDDRPKPAIGEFTNADVKEGSFNYTNNKKSDEFTAVDLAYIDSNDNYKPKIEYIEDTESIRKRGLLKKQINAFGMTTRAQAIRFGRNFLAQTSSENSHVNFITDSRALMYKPGDLIKIHDELCGTYRNYGIIRKFEDLNDFCFCVIVDKPLMAEYFLDNEISIALPRAKPTYEDFSYVSKRAAKGLVLNNFSNFNVNKNVIENNPNLLACVPDGIIFNKVEDIFIPSIVKCYTGIVPFNYYTSVTNFQSNVIYKTCEYLSTLEYICGINMNGEVDNYGHWNMCFRNADFCYRFDSLGDPTLKFQLASKEYFFAYIDCGKAIIPSTSTSFNFPIQNTNFNKKTFIVSCYEPATITYADIIQNDRPSIESFNISSYDNLNTLNSNGTAYSELVLLKNDNDSLGLNLCNLVLGAPFSYTVKNKCEKLYKIMSISENYINEYNIMASEFDVDKFCRIENGIPKDDLESTFSSMYKYKKSTSIKDGRIVNTPNILSLERVVYLNEIYLEIRWNTVLNADSYVLEITTPSKQTSNFVIEIKKTETVHFNSLNNYWFYRFKPSLNEVGTYTMSIASTINDGSLWKYSSYANKSIVLLNY